MKKSEINNKVQQALEEFETIENIQPSTGWELSLMEKVSSKNLRPTSTFSKTKIVGVVIFFALINVGFFLSMMLHNTQQGLGRNRELQLISKELLINPTSLNN